MKIICHRGHWLNHNDQNSLMSIRRSFDFDGVEIDIRSLDKKIVLSHDPVLSRKKYTSLEDAFRTKAPQNFFWALNIKEDGLGSELKKLLSKYKIKNYMCFDLSFPESVLYRKSGLEIFNRYGDREPEISGKKLVFDCFSTRNFRSSLRRIPPSSTLMVISPELHGHGHSGAWRELRTHSFKDTLLCTDFPAEAGKYFNGR